MSDNHSIFFDEWRQCLYAHYIHVLRAGDAITEPTLRRVLLNSGLTDTDIAQMRAKALELGPLIPGTAWLFDDESPAEDFPAENAPGGDTADTAVLLDDAPSSEDAPLEDGAPFSSDAPEDYVPAPDTVPPDDNDPGDDDWPDDPGLLDEESPDDTPPDSDPNAGAQLSLF
ncbi:MAG: hypothetical protein JXQ72_00175 [Anaerolineae bacterium]|nr:hypothetical protein [Anaerolineae bacterium]